MDLLIVGEPSIFNSLCEAGALRYLDSRELIEEARRTDYAMPTVLPFVPAILSPIAVLALLLGLLTAAMTRGLRGGGLLLVGVVLLVVAVLMGFYVVYRWIRRRNEHFRRSLAFFEVVTEIAELLNLGRAPWLGLGSTSSGRLTPGSGTL